MAVGNGFGPGLHGKHLVGKAILRPLKIHEHVVVLLNLQETAVQLLSHGLSEHEWGPLSGQRIGIFDAGSGFVLGLA